MDRCRVWESHADQVVRRMTKPTPDLMYPTYAVGDTDNDKEVTRVAGVTGLRSDQNQFEDLLRSIVSAVEHPAPIPEISDMEKLLLQLAREPPDGPPAVVNTPVPFPRCTAPTATAASATAATSKTDWSDVMCFSCGKMGHAASRCPDFNDSFPFLQPGCQKEKTPGGFIMISPRVTMDRRRAENGD